jgi:malonate decarboxylase gamma subunit
VPLGFPSLRVNHTNSLHHLWCNNGTWWVHYTLHFDHRKRRIRRSLKTNDLAEAVRRRDELLGLNRYMAHLGCCVDLARRSGHRVVGLVYDQALSGGFITSGLMADACYALPEAEIRVMRIPAMSRVTKISEDLLQALSLTNPVFAPGVANYVAMGGIQALWTEDLKQGLLDALAATNTVDIRATLGAERGGRALAASVIQRVLAA